MEEGLTRALNAAGGHATDPRTVPALTYAFLGDAVFELLSRSYVVEQGNTSPRRLHMKNSAIVSAPAQAEAFLRLEEKLTDEEREILRRGLNAKPNSQAKNASSLEYHRATGLEVLFGYLYLAGRMDRARELFLLALESGDGGPEE